MSYSVTAYNVMIGSPTDVVDRELVEKILAKWNHIHGEEKKSGVTFKFVKASMADREVVNVLFQIYKPDIVVNLVAQAGVRYGINQSGRIYSVKSRGLL